MSRVFSDKFHVLILMCLSFNAWALQDGIVIVDRAVIYGDREMSSPLGYIRKGKKVRLGQIPRNRAQVYPIAVSGKIGYIRIQDVSTEISAINDDYLAAERFTKTTKKNNLDSRYSLGYLLYNSQVSLGDENGELKNNDPVTWSGFTLRGEVELNPSWDFGIVFNFLQASSGTEKFRMLEMGGVLGYKIYQGDKLTLRWDNQGLLIPWGSYALGSDFRVNGYGLTVGTGITALYQVGENFGIEGFGGFYYTKLMGFEPPAPYKAIDPTFMGTRLGLGLNYQL